jgi:hypothetical protein
MQITCPICGESREVCKKYAQSRNKNRPCASCSLKKRWTDPEIRAKNCEGLSRSSKKKWEEPEYRQKIISSLPKPTKKPTKVSVKCPVCGIERLIGRRYAQGKKKGESETNATRPCSSCSMKKKWLNQEYKQQIAKSVSENTKKLWETPEFRKAVTESNSTTWTKRADELSKRALELWQSEEYSNKTKAGMNTPEAHEKLSAAVIACWESQEHREKMGAIYDSIEYKEKMQVIFSSPEIKEKIAAASTARWANPDYRKHMVEVGRANWSNDEYRKKMIAILNSDEVKEKLAKVRATQSDHISSIQSMLYFYLDELGVEYYKEGEQTRIGYYVFDCLIINDNKRLLIECQGDYWHALEDMERRDRGKFTYISKYFPEHEIMYVWEHEFYCKDRVLDRLKLKLGIGIETKEFKFSDLVIREINSAETKTFLDLYHYLGKDRGGKAFGVFDDDLLVAAIVFSPPLRQNTAGQFGLLDGEVRELSRLCIHPSYHKKNFASWFIKRALKQIECKLVVAYADTTVGHNGGIYKASNFQLHHTVPADYWYVDAQGYVMHKRTLYGRARNLKMTENEFAEAKGYVKKYGGEKLCFVRFTSFADIQKSL